jgi:putative redox protein
MEVRAVSRKEPYLVELSTDEHNWVADEPEENGGGCTGPKPFELLLSAVGACMAITARMYAKRKNWPLDSIGVELDHSRLRAEDCDGCQTEQGFVSLIEIRLKIEGDLDHSQRERIAEIAGRCPVKRSLEGEVKIRSELISNQ